MPDVVLPVLDELDAIPWVLERIPAGYTPIVVDNGSSDGSGELAAELGAQVVHEPRPGFGAACFAGLVAARAGVVCFMDCDASFDPRELPRVADPVASGAADLVLGARSPVPGAAWPLHARAANSLLAFELRRRTGAGLSDLGPMRAARREALLGLGIRDRRFGWPLEMVLLASAAGWRLEEVTVSYLAREGRSKITGTVRGTARAVRDMAGVLDEPRGDMAPALLVIAKAPVPGRVKTRLTPPCTPSQAARLARAALEDTLDAALAAGRAGRRVLVLDGRPGPWLPAGFEVIAQRGDGLAERLAAAFADAGGPAFLVGMDTPQVTPALLDSGLRAVEVGDAAFGAAPDGGYWGIGLRRPDARVFDGIPMSEATTGAAQRARLRALGLRTVSLAPLRDVDTIEDARAVAAAAPAGRFARALAATAVEGIAA